MKITTQSDCIEKTRLYMISGDKEIKGFFGDYMFLSNFAISNFYISTFCGEVQFESA